MLARRHLFVGAASLPAAAACAPLLEGLWPQELLEGFWLHQLLAGAGLLAACLLARRCGLFFGAAAKAGAPAAVDAASALSAAATMRQWPAGYCASKPAAAPKYKACIKRCADPLRLARLKNKGLAREGGGGYAEKASR